MVRGWWLFAALAGAIGCHHVDDFPVYVPPVVDAAASCGLVSCDSLHATCGPYGDGCGNTFDCGTCTSPDVCGGGGAFTCGPRACTARTCDDAGAKCGQIADGCGGLTASCGTCTTAGDTCGGGGVANVCGKPPCTGLCTQQATCATPTKITGVVTAPGHDDVATWGTPDPIYGAVVYIPNGAAGAPTYGVTAFAPGVACESCSSVVSGSPLVLATTGVDGSFTLDNAPCGTDIPLVVQLDRWRRQIVIPSVACCGTTTLTANQTHLPRTHTGEPGDVRSDIPLMAVSTGAADPLHCVLRKIGVADTEFTDPSGAGRVHMYRDNGARADASTPTAAALYDSAAELAKHDMTLFECTGERDPKTLAEQQHVTDYANAGGRVFASHFSYVWLTNNDGTSSASTGPYPFERTATWLVDQALADSVVATVDQTLQGDPATQARRKAFASWLQVVGASTVPGQIAIAQVRNDLVAVSGIAATAARTPPQRWLSTTSPFAAPLHYTFDTPVAYAPAGLPTKQCGRVLFSDFHVASPGPIDDTTTFPTECAPGTLSAQEKTLEFMLFDLASCIGPAPSDCKPATCADQHLFCGSAGDGCDDGVVLDCGDCFDGQYCGGGDPATGTACGYGTCVPRTCADAGANCGNLGNGCGGLVDCGDTCPDGQTCGGSGIPNACGVVLR